MQDTKQEERGNLFQYKLRHNTSWPTPEKKWKYETVAWSKPVAL